MSEKKRLVIECRCIPCHDWMAFASWYSFRKMIPEVEVKIDVDLSLPIFRWISTYGLKAKVREPDEIVIPPTVLAVRDFVGDWSLSPSKSTIQTCLVDYSEGCGNFVVDKWINTNRHPFHNALRRFGTSAMTVNEVAVLKVWERCDAVYRAAGV